MAFDAEFVSHGRVAQIGIDEQHTLAFLGESHGNIGGNRGFTFGRIGRGDDQQSAMTLRSVVVRNERFVRMRRNSSASLPAG